MASLPYKIKADSQNELWRNYMARCMRMATENIAIITQGKYMQVEFEDLINPKPEEKRSADDIIAEMKNKIDKMK